ncbi:MAG: cupredoxin domain-containing protein [Candidatus Limnocylindrales bacterium]
MRSILALGVAIALALMLAGCSSTPTDTSATGNAVTISDFAFKPDVLTVKVGTTVTWTNKDSTGHDVKWDDGAPGSETLSTGQSYTRTFATAGTFTYICGIHASMKGKITVTP